VPYIYGNRKFQLAMSSMTILKFAQSKLELEKWHMLIFTIHHLNLMHRERTVLHSNQRLKQADFRQNTTVFINAGK
jgi:hypothetical protein